MIQVAEGGCKKSVTILIRLRELGVQGASDTIGPVERQLLNVEYQQLLDEMIVSQILLSFNGTPLLSGTGAVLDFQ